MAKRKSAASLASKHPAVKGAVSKKIPVEDVNGNKHILKATVIQVDRNLTKSGESNEIQDDLLQQLGISNKIVEPPLNQTELSVIHEFSSELGQVVESMAVGVEGFGHRLIPRIPDKEDQKKIKSPMEEERKFLRSLFMFPNADEDFVRLRKDTRKDLENSGNAYWELIKSDVAKNKDRFNCINRLDIGTMFITRPAKELVRIRVRYVEEDGELKNKIFPIRPRLLVQIVGRKKVFFKFFRDPRIINKKTGDVIAKNVNEFGKLDRETQKANPEKVWANEVLHLKIGSPRRTPYGMPRYAGNIISVKGSRGADETNIITQQNNHMPSMAILVSGGQLTEGSIQRIKEFVDTQIKGDANYSKFLLIEGESMHDTLTQPGNFKIEIKPLSENQHKDQLWQDYDNNNADKVRRSWRTPPIMVGKTDGLNRNTAETSERFAEKYVYNPEREEMDVNINQLLQQQGIRWWIFKSNSPNVTNDEDLVKILTGAEKSGGLTPRISRFLLEDILNRELPPIKEGDEFFDPDVPFSLSLAKLQQGAGIANQMGTSSPQGQNPAPPGQPGRPPKQDDEEEVEPPDEVDKVFQNIDPHFKLEEALGKPKKFLKGLVALRDALEKNLG